MMKVEADGCGFPACQDSYSNTVRYANAVAHGGTTMSELTLEVGQANEIKLAARRAGATNADLKVLSKGDMFARILPVLRGRAKVVVSSILTLLRTVSIAVQPAATTSKEYFEQAGVKSMGQNFQNQFLGLEIAATPETELAVRKLEESSLDAPIMSELGEKAETSTSQFRAFLDANRGSQEWFIFYLRGKDGNLWAVYAYWDGRLEGWHVEAHSVEYSRRWYAGYRVVSRN